MDKLWEEMTSKEQKAYEDNWVNDMVREGGGTKKDARLRFDVGFDCTFYNERVYARRDIALATGANKVVELLDADNDVEEPWGPW